MEGGSMNDARSVTLPMQQWQLVVQLLSEAPYRVSAPLINELSRQLMAVPIVTQPIQPPAVKADGTGS